jgi:hypothetical protein
MKTKGFTILELLAGMTATSIVIGTAFVALNITGRMTNAMKLSYSRSADLSMSHTQLCRDIFHADSCVVDNEQSATLLMPDSEIVRYVSGNGIAVRIAGEIKDTIPFDIVFNSKSSIPKAQLIINNQQYEIPLRKEKDDSQLKKCIDEWKEYCIEIKKTHD